MPSMQFSAQQDVPEPIRAGLERLIEELDVRTEFPEDVVKAAAQAAHSQPSVALDLTAIEFVTIDPQGSMDLDQAMYIERDGDGYLVYYAIADVASWVHPGDPLDHECQLRGQTFYAPHARFPLHPSELSEGAASLLPEAAPRPAMVWALRLDAEGEVTRALVQRALVRSRERYTYVGVQEMLDAREAPEVFTLLKEVGLKREQLERSRGGVSLPIPAQEVDVVDGKWQLAFRSPLPVEGWNAQISLMTGMCAARIMIEHKMGIVRTLPPVDPEDLAKLRRTAKALRIDWPRDVDYPEFLRSLDRENPAHMAMMQKCTALFRGAGYMSFDGELPQENFEHNALAAEYAHTTAPLRRLVDRYVLVICEALCSGTEVPSWAREALPGLPATMKNSDKRAKAFERGINDLVEALVCAGRVGERFTGVIVDAVNPKFGAKIMIAEPAIEATVLGEVRLGDEVEVELTSVDLERGQVTFHVVAEPHR